MKIISKIFGWFFKPSKYKIYKNQQIKVVSLFHGVNGPTSAEEYVVAYNQGEEWVTNFIKEESRYTDSAIYLPGDTVVIIDADFVNYNNIVKIMGKDGRVKWTSASAIRKQLKYTN